MMKVQAMLDERRKRMLASARISALNLLGVEKAGLCTFHLQPASIGVVSSGVRLAKREHQRQEGVS